MIISAIHGYRKGFLRIVISLVGLVVVIMAVTVIAPYVSSFLMEKTPLYDNVRQKVVSVFAEQNAKLDNTVPENQTDTINSYNLPELISGALIENNKQEIYDALKATIFEEYVSGYVARLIIKSGSFIGLVLALWIVVWILLFAADILNRIPVLRTFNRLMGLGTGFIIGLIIVWLLFLIVITFFGNEISAWVLSRVRESQLLTYIFNSNPLFRFVSQ